MAIGASVAQPVPSTLVVVDVESIPASCFTLALNVRVHSKDADSIRQLQYKSKPGVPS